MIKKLALSTLILLLAACGEQQAASPAEGVAVTEQKTFKWKLVTTWPKNYPGLGMAPENFATLVDRMSQGRLKLKVYGAGQMVPAMEVFDAVSQGTAEMGHGAAYYWKGKFRPRYFLPLYLSVSMLRK